MSGLTYFTHAWHFVKTTQVVFCISRLKVLHVTVTDKWLGLPSTLRIVVKTDPLKMFFKPEEFENASFAFYRKHFENRASWKQWSHDNHVISLLESSSSTNSKWLVIFPL